MRKDRLERLANLLENVPLDKFNMDVWVDLPDADFSDAVLAAWSDADPDHTAFVDLDTDKALGKNVCGTAACAMGWATTLPEFRKAGYVMRTIRYETSDGSIMYRNPVPVRDGMQGFSACGMDFFALDEGQLDYLFLPSSYTDDNGISEPATPKRVANRIRLLIKHPAIYRSAGAERL